MQSLTFVCLVEFAGNSRRRLMVERWGLEPNCWSDSRLWVSRNGAKREAKFISRRVPMMEIGRLGDNMCGCAGLRQV